MDESGGRLPANMEWVHEALELSMPPETTINRNTLQKSRASTASPAAADPVAPESGVSAVSRARPLPVHSATGLGDPDPPGSSKRRAWARRFGRLVAADLDVLSSLAEAEIALPRGEVSRALGPAWRARTGLARIVGRGLEGPGWAAPLLPVEHATAGALPRMLPVHPIRSLAAIQGLRALPLSSCATNLADAEPLRALGFWRVCAPGDLQRPPVSAEHDGWDVMGRLCGPR